MITLQAAGVFLVLVFNAGAEKQVHFERQRDMIACLSERDLLARQPRAVDWQMACIERPQIRGRAIP